MRGDRQLRIALRILYSEVESWIETDRRMWEQRLDRLDNYLTELQSKSNPEKTTRLVS